MGIFDQLDQKTLNLVMLKDYFQRFSSSITLSFGLTVIVVVNNAKMIKMVLDIMHSVQNQPLDQLKSLGSCQPLAVEPHNSSTIASL